jgi:hypothetical protein
MLHMKLLMITIIKISNIIPGGSDSVLIPLSFILKR